MRVLELVCCCCCSCCCWWRVDMFWEAWVRSILVLLEVMVLVLRGRIAVGFTIPCTKQNKTKHNKTLDFFVIFVSDQFENRYPFTQHSYFKILGPELNSVIMLNQNLKIICICIFC
uniref:Uncharacterized protein n=1 Tax=Cacopsylla melanoneura TaxID=428564 RepID=A0A8D8VIQ7_9HEMI